MTQPPVNEDMTDVEISALGAFCLLPVLHLGLQYVIMPRSLDVHSPLLTGYKWDTFPVKFCFCRLSTDSQGKI